jgi:DNA polymerase III delta prime subunit
MNISFLKKYQPKYYKDFYIKKDYIDILKTLQKMDNLNILFIGRKGIGKTSMILASVREYYNSDIIPKHNVLFINSLKEQGIQYYRNNLKTFCQTQCSIPKKKKIIILDDFDFINEQSQQVFRNYIDKYSHKVNFLISCKNNQKVIDNIQSRTTIIKLSPIEKTNFKILFDKIKKNEKIKITEKAEKFLFCICSNSISQLLNNMEKFKLYNKEITIDNVKDICTNISFFLLENYTTACINKNYEKSIKIIFNIYNKGYSVLDILDNFFYFIKITDFINEEKKYKVIKLICKYIEIFYTIHENEIELAFFTNNLINNLT